jgi:serine/threonine protein kinase
MPCGSRSLISDVKGNYWKSDVQSVARALSQILGCLHFVHDNGYVHRDVALRNFVYFDDAIKVVDFGSAKSISEEPDSLFRDYRALIHMAAEMLQLCDDCGEADKPKTKKEKERFLLSKFAKVKPPHVSEKEKLMHDMARLCTKGKLGTQEDWLKVVQLDQVPS